MSKRCELAVKIGRDTTKHRVAVLRSHVDAASAHDIDGVHDLRVASRRLRAILGDHRQLFGKRARKRFQSRIRDITRGLGVARELDVCLRLLHEQTNNIPAPARRSAGNLATWLHIKREDHSGFVDAACAAVRDHDFRRELRDLLHSLRSKRCCYLKEIKGLLGNRYTQLVDAYRIWRKKQSEDDLHAVRVAFKKLRYSCEIVEEIYGDSMKSFIDHMKSAQEALGDWNDLRVLRNYMRQYDTEHPDEADTIKTLIAWADKGIAVELARFTKTSSHLFEKRGAAEAENVFASPITACCSTKSKPKKTGK